MAEPTREERDGQALAEKLRSSIPEEASEIRGIFKIRSAKYKVTNDVPVICQIVLGETSWETVYETKATSHLGAEKLVVRHFPDQPSEYLYARAETPAAPLPEPKKLSPAAAEIPLASSDFWLTDLGLEFLHWPQQHRRGPRDREPALRLGRAYDILESVNPAGKEVVRVKSCIDKETGGILVAEAFDAQNKLAKEFTLSSSSFKKVKGVWQLERMTMMNPPKKSTTVLQFDLSKE